MRYPTPTTILTLSLLCGTAAAARAQVADGLLDPNVATEEQLVSLPHVGAELAAGLIAQRPFAGAPALDAFLAEAGLTPEQRAEVYAQAFIHVNLDTAAREELMLIPGVGQRMAHELEEYRPWKSKARFEREIGKYVDADEVARLWRYGFIPMDLNTASEADFLTIPGVGRRMAHEFEEYRPWKTQTQFEREIGKYVDAGEVARLWRYFVIP